LRALNNVATQDGYVAATTVQQPGAVRVNMDITVAAVYVSLGTGDSGGVAFDAEVFRTPGKYSLDRVCSAARVRSAVAGTPAQVTLELLTAADLEAR
jgi:hypothetical protein